MRRSGYQQGSISLRTVTTILLCASLVLVGMGVWMQMRPAERPDSSSAAAHAGSSENLKTSATPTTSDAKPTVAEYVAPAVLDSPATAPVSPAQSSVPQVANQPAAVAGNPDAAPADTVRLSADMHGEEAITALGDKLADVAAAHHMSAEALRHELRKDSDLWVGEAGQLFYACTMLKEPASAKDEPAKVGNSAVRAVTDPTTVEADTV